jgi:very-short-patch-repair endonuclease
VVLHESQDLVAADRACIDAIPVTSALRTVLDIGCVVTSSVLESWVDEGLRRRLFTLEQLRRRHSEVARRGRNGCGPLGELLRSRDSSQRRAESGFEVRLSRLLEANGWRRPDRQFSVVDDQGTFLGRADLAYPRFRVLMEADSETWHIGIERFHRDRHRRNLMRAAGFEILEYTWHHVHHDHGHVLGTLAAVVERQAALLGFAARELRC